MTDNKSKTRLYKLTHRESGGERIVQAVSQPQALGHVARTDWRVEVLSTPDAFRLAREGVPAEVAGTDDGSAEPEQAGAFASA